jgi:hypothetical protein
MRLSTRIDRTLRLARAASHALVDRFHPLLVRMVPMRRCGLSCAYCNEYDAVSKPVSIDLLRTRLDRIASLGAAAVALSGGEPLQHPDLDGMIRHARSRGLLVAVSTNGNHLSPDRIAALNRAGLDHLQVAVDDVERDQGSTKSLALLEPKLRWLAEGADFTVAIRSLLAGGEVRKLGGSATSRLGERFQDRVVPGLPNDWSCRAGARYLYIDEHGLVHYCSQQRGKPAIPIESYTQEDIRREYHAKKPCAPFCTVSAAQQIAIADSWRSPQTGEATLAHHPATPPPSDGPLAG